MAVIAICAWFAVGLQFYITLSSYSSERTLVGILVLLFSYFTIQSNLLAAFSLSVILLSPLSGLGRFFSRKSVLTAIAVYILIVGLVYAIVLRSLWNPQGLSRIADEMLHTATPLLFLLFWLIVIPKGSLKWRDAFTLLWYPLAYLIYILIRGAISGMYPYPFIDAGKIGYPHVALSAVILLIAFLGTGCLLTGIDKLFAKSDVLISTN